jgi:serine/threonine protein kinase
VWRGKWRDTTVAVKTLHDPSGSQLAEFFREVSVMSMLPPHPHVVRYYGVCQEVGKFMMIMEFVPNGSLHTHLEKKKSSSELSTPLFLGFPPQVID